MPPLRRRIEDLPHLVEIFLSEIARKNRAIGKKPAPEALDLLCRYAWPGNVRELKNLLDRLSIMVEGEVITARDIPFPIHAADVCEPADNMDLSLFAIPRLKDAQKAFEEEFIRRKLIENHQDVAETARAVGVGQSTIKSYLKQIHRTV